MMAGMLPRLTAVLLLNLALIPAGHALEQGSLATCQSIKDRIDYYTDLKRKGGSSSKMASLQKQRNKYQALFAENLCRNYLGRLK